MAGSYNHVINDDGNLASPLHVARMLENGGDIFEAVEEMYGMIWLLASMAEGDTSSTWTRAQIVEHAREHYKAGLEVAKNTPDKEKKR